MTMATQTQDGKDLTDAIEATIIGMAISAVGTGPNAVVTVQDLQGNLFTAPAKDMDAPQGVGPLISRNGKPFSVGSPVTVPATVLSVVSSTSVVNIQTQSVAQASTAISPKVVTQPVSSKSVRAPHKK
jgi:hypothetical protein